MMKRTLVALTAVMVLWIGGCGSVERRPLVLIEPEYSYLRDEARLAAPPAPTSTTASARRDLSVPIAAAAVTRLP